MKKFRGSNTILFKLTASYILITFFCVFITGVLANTIFYKYFNEQISLTNQIILRNVQKSVETEILNKVDELYLSLVTENSSNKTYLSTFSSKEVEDYKKIKEIQEFLSAKQVLNADWLAGLSTYFVRPNLAVSSSGLLYKNDSRGSQKPQWLEKLLDGERPEYLPTVSAESVWFSQYENICILIKRIPLYNEETSADGYIVFEISEDTLKSIMAKSLDDKNSGSILICDAEGNIISSTGTVKYPYTIKDTALFEQVMQNDSSEDSGAVILNGERQIVSHTSFRRFGWKLISVIPKNRYYRASLFLRISVLLVCIAAIAIGAAVSYFFSKRLYNPIKRIVERVSKVNGHQADKEKDEYTIINTAISDMSGKISNLEHTLSSNQPLIKNNLVLGLIYNKIGTREELNEMLQILERSFDGDFYAAVIYQLDKDITENLSIENRSFMLYNTIDEIEKMSDGSVQYFAAELDPTTIVIIAAFGNCRPEKRISEDLAYLNDYLMLNFYMNCSAAVGGLTASPKQISKSFTEAKRTLDYRKLMPDAKIIFREDIEHRDNSDAQIPQTYFDDLGRYVSLGKVGEIKKSIRQIISEMVNGPYSAEQCSLKMMEIVSVFSVFLREHHIKSVYVLDREMLSGFNEIRDVYEFEDWMMSLVDHAFDCIENMAKDSGSQIIENAKAYIEAHLSEELSLFMVSEHVFISSQYLSKVFKEKTGMNFSDYVTNVRMEKAKELLLETTMNIENIAAAVGYNTPHYFIRKFKEKYGMTPKSFRLNR